MNVINMIFKANIQKIGGLAMRLKNFLKPEYFMEVSFIRQFALAFILMSLVPMGFFVYIIYSLNLGDFVEHNIPYFSLTVIFIVLMCLASYDLIRRNIIALHAFVVKAQELLEKETGHIIQVRSSGDVKKTVELFNRLLQKERSGVSRNV
jgi:hypothetical protein